MPLGPGKGPFGYGDCSRRLERRSVTRRQTTAVRNLPTVAQVYQGR